MSIHPASLSSRPIQPCRLPTFQAQVVSLEGGLWLSEAMAEVRQEPELLPELLPELALCSLERALR